jgi:DNA mismatch repair protein MutL
MKFIKVLPEGLIDRIAAGEVIENPASVVKELVENSLDAGAGNIEISVAGGGKEEILIVDDGEGIPKDQVELAFMRHATSKIKSWEDLLKTGSMGFRGEALPSISSVSIMEASTCYSGEQVGSRIRFEGGRQMHFGPGPPRKGCSISVRNLFYNVPARRKFLKSESSEKRRIAEVARRYIIARHDVGFKIIYGAKGSRTFPAATILSNRLEGVWGNKIIADSVCVDDDAVGPLKIHGFISLPTTTRGNRSEVFFFVNKRPVMERAMFGAVAAAYENSIARGQYPYVALFLDIDPNFVDINVHPAKIEVRFSDEGFIFGAMKNAMKKALHLPAGISMRAPSLARTNAPVSFDQAGDGLFEQVGRGVSGLSSGDNRQSVLEPTHTVEAEWEMLGENRFMQMLDTYIIVGRGEELVILDQHTAHERILFERTLESFEKNPAPSQKLLFETRVKLNPEETVLAGEISGLLARAGFEIREFAPDEVIVSGLPRELAGVSPDKALKDVLSIFASRKKGGEGTKRALAAGVACRAAIKAGQRLSGDQMRALYSDLRKCREPFRCPHGRPTLAVLRRDDFEKIFGRK